MPSSLLRACAALLSFAAAGAQAGGFASTGDMVWPRTVHTATLMNDGRVLIAGGNRPSEERPGSAHVAPIVRAPSALAEIYDPATGLFGATGGLVVPRFDHAAAALADGRVLVVGGYGNDETQSNGELFDPATGVFTAIKSGEIVGGERSTATVLTDGRVLVIGGFRQGPRNTAQLFDAATNTFAQTGTLNVGRYVHTATRLLDGRVLVVGGLGGNAVRSDAEIYDPATGTFTLLPATMSVTRERHAAALLPDGRVLIAGGYTVGEQLTSAELWNPATGTFAPAANTMAVPRVDYQMRTLGNGKVLLIGSQRFDLTASTAELFDPATNAFSSIAPGPATERGSGEATVLADGRVLLSGGSDLLDPKGGRVLFGELYTPEVVDSVFVDGFEL